ncbi:hypothetical protein Tco_1358533 [Tanacetum coccineum]
MDACPNAKEIWIAIESLQQGESINIQDVKTKLFWEFGKFTSKDGESIESYYTRFYKMMYKMVRNKLKVDNMQVNVQFLQQLQLEWSRFVKIVKQANNLDNVSYHTLFDILKQHQNEVNEIRAERIARNVNPLALVAATQNYQDDYYKHLKHQNLTNLIHHHQDKQHQTDYILLPRTKAKRLSNNLHLNLSQHLKKTGFGHFAKEYRKPKRVKDYEYHKEKMMLCKQESKGIPLSTEHDEWLQDTYEESDGQELEAHYIYMAKIQEVLHVIDDNSGPTYDAEPLEKDEQNAKEPEDECVLLASLIANLKLDVDENKKIQKQLNKANTFANPEYLKKSQWGKPYLYNVQYDKNDLANMFAPESEETIRLAEKSITKLEKTNKSISKSKYAFQDVQANVDNIKSIVETDWQQHKIGWQNPITHDIKLLIHDMFIALAHKTLKNVGIFENALKEEMLEDLKYVKSVEKEFDDLKMEINDLKAQL